jgi:hypothetical protein
MPAPKTPTIIGSTTVRAKSEAMAASMAFPPAASISAPATEASGWFVPTTPREAVTGRFSVSNSVPARLRQPLAVMLASRRGSASTACLRADTPLVQAHPTPERTLTTRRGSKATLHATALDETGSIA